MTRYLVLEVTDEVHDLTDLIEDMRLGTEQQLYAGGYVLDVCIPAQPLVADMGQIRGTDAHIYVTEAR